MQRLYIVSGNFYDFDNLRPTIGGIQTYILELIPIFINNGFDDITVFVNDKYLRTQEEPLYKIVSYNIEEGADFTKKLASFVKSHIKDPLDLVLYDTDERLPQGPYFNNLIALQHGVCWDIPYKTTHSITRMVLSRALRAYKRVRKYSYVKALICVDYNFVNWYRTQVDYVKTKLFVIPNNTRIAPVYHKDSKCINIIFARRLCWYRGTKVFCNAIIRILEEFSNINVVVAGEGPDEQWLHEQLDGYKNVRFIKYKSSDSLFIHEDKHIAIVPTIGSEGTSLSLLEAMSAQCAVIASNVGGMTNIVLDGYNGLLVEPENAQDLYTKIKMLLTHKEIMEELATNAYNTVKKAFSHERWESEWNGVVEEIKTILEK